MKNNILLEELTEYINEGVSEMLLPYESKTKLRFNDFCEVHDDYVVAEFYGGLNGYGEWTNYLKAILDLFKVFDDYDCWLVSLENDCLDDVFTLKIGISYKPV